MEDEQQQWCESGFMLMFKRMNVCCLKASEDKHKMHNEWLKTA